MHESAKEEERSPKRKIQGFINCRIILGFKQLFLNILNNRYFKIGHFFFTDK